MVEQWKNILPLWFLCSDEQRGCRGLNSSAVQHFSCIFSQWHNLIAIVKQPGNEELLIQSKNYYQYETVVKYILQLSVLIPVKPPNIPDQAICSCSVMFAASRTSARSLSVAASPWRGRSRGTPRRRAANSTRWKRLATICSTHAGLSALRPWITSCRWASVASLLQHFMSLVFGRPFSCILWWLWRFGLVTTWKHLGPAWSLFEVDTQSNLIKASGDSVNNTVITW